jgi:hypothetical protein
MTALQNDWVNPAHKAPLSKKISLTVFQSPTECDVRFVAGRNTPQIADQAFQSPTECDVRFVIERGAIRATQSIVSISYGV